MNKSTNDRRGNSKSFLLTTVSALALTVSAYGIDPAHAGEPPVWIELGYQSSHVYDSSDSFVLPLGGINLPSDVPRPLMGGLLLSHSYGDDGKITFRPDDTHWVFSASITYGRSTGRRRGVTDISEPFPTTSFATYHTTIPTYPFPFHYTRNKPSHVTADLVHVETVSSEAHYMLDFQAGYDVGLGLFGKHSTSTVGIGVRFAQLKSSLNIANFRAVPDAHLEYHHSTFPTLAFFPSGVQVVPWYHNGYTQNWHNLAGNGKSSHDFSGLGPSVYWDASAPVWGETEHGGEISIDWGINGAVLYGKQKNKAQHQTIGNYYCYGQLCPNEPHLQHFNPNIPTAHLYQASASARSEKNVTVPNLGGFVGLSYRFEDIKLSAGYRGDFFFHAIDTGTGHSITRGFQGPYASVSIGIGD